ncbi:hypothetical protein [Fundidesulfovibrio agrisoli]|uniref:hypothetical protein n=1 Tax=Fundidesulfovibrio agrisoli TaxID=2922717 RepID=UPI001FAB7C9E|nr:hypothetical protein [Fundidesulfovibrio agrisoli]
MRGDDFRRGSSGCDDASGEDAGETTRPELIPQTGRDNIQMFWESIGMKPGDDWKNEAADGEGDAGK